MASVLFVALCTLMFVCVRARDAGDLLFGIRARSNTNGSRILEVVRYNVSSGRTMTVVTLDNSLGWYQTAAATYTTDGTYFTALAESTKSSSLYAIDLNEGKIKARLKRQPPFSSLHILDENRMILGVAACTDGSSAGDCIYTVPLNMSEPATLVGNFPANWAAVDTHGVTLVRHRQSGAQDASFLYAIAANARNMSVNHASLFGWSIERNGTPRLISQPGRVYGGPTVTYSLFGDPDATVSALAQDNSKQHPAYYVVRINATTWERVPGTRVEVYANNEHGFDAYPAVVGGGEDAVVVAFYVRKIPQSHREPLSVPDVDTKILKHDTLTNTDTPPRIDLMLMRRGHVSVVTGWNQNIINLVLI